MVRKDGRAHDALRQVRITRNFIRHAEGSVLVEVGDTRVICTASIDEKVPQFLRGQGQGWVTAEYAMLPRATPTRTQRERGSAGGRSQEIQRLVGRSLRAVVDMNRLGERAIVIDCDVIQADGGTRTASITGGFLALADALHYLGVTGKTAQEPLRDCVAATSVGILGKEFFIDLDYFEDSSAEVDMNVVMTGAGQFVEIQGTAEQTPFTQEQLRELLTLAERGIRRLIGLQREALRKRDQTVFTL